MSHRLKPRGERDVIRLRNATEDKRAFRRMLTSADQSIRARVRARENHVKPLVRTSFLYTRPSCLPSPGRPFFCTDDRKKIITEIAGQPSKYCNYPLTTTRGDRFASCENIVSTSQTSSLSPLHRLSPHPTPRLRWRPCVSPFD